MTCAHSCIPVDLITSALYGTLMEADVEPVHLIAQGLPVCAANTRSRLPAWALCNDRKRQQPAALIAILRCLCKPVKVMGGKIGAKANGCRHGAHLLRTSGNTHAARLETQMNQIEMQLA
jgi:hypothetical protein